MTALVEDKLLRNGTLYHGNGLVGQVGLAGDVLDLSVVAGHRSEHHDGQQEHHGSMAALAARLRQNLEQHAYQPCNEEIDHRYGYQGEKSIEGTRTDDV